MNCPVDNEVLQMSERQGVEVDYCPRCRGVWLDRGELDKIMERAAVELVPGDDRPDRRERHDSDRYDSDRYDSDRYDSDRYDSDRYDRDRDDWGRGHQRRHKKKSFLNDIFEFGD